MTTIRVYITANWQHAMIMAMKVLRNQIFHSTTFDLVGTMEAYLFYSGSLEQLEWDVVFDKLGHGWRLSSQIGYTLQCMNTKQYDGRKKGEELNNG